MHNTAKKLADFVTSVNCKDEMKDAYTYVFQIILETVIAFLTTLFIAVLLGKVLDFLVFICVFICIRNLAGGFHFSTFFKCYLATTFVVTCMLVSIVYLPLTGEVNYILILLFLLSVLIVAPVEDVNRKFTKEERKYLFRKLALRMVIIAFVSTIMLFINAINILINVRNACVLASGICYLGILKAKFSKH